MDTLAARITGRRKELGLSSTDLADLIGISLPAVLKWEKGATANLKHEHLFTLADALNVHVRWLALGEGPKIAYPGREAHRLALARRDEADGDRAKLVWGRLAAALARAAVVIVFLVPPFLAPQPAQAATLHNNYLPPSVIHIVSRLRRRLAAFAAGMRRMVPLRFAF